MFQQLKAWYFQTFLPFEDPSHELFYDHQAELKKEAELDALWAEIEDAPYQVQFVTSSNPNHTHRL